MLRFSDFSHLPEADGLVREMLDEPSGVLLVAGPDGRPGGTGGFLPSGRTTIFRILAAELLDAQPTARCAIVSRDRDVLHVARRFRQRIEFIHVQPPLTYAEALSTANRDNTVLIVDRLSSDNLPAVLGAGGRARVLTQFDTIYHGAGVIRHLISLGAPGPAVEAIRWVITVQRFATLCLHCRQPAVVSTEQLARLDSLSKRFSALGKPDTPTAYYSLSGCPHCHDSGRQGDVAAFDFFQAAAPPPALTDQPSRLPLEAYVWSLAQRGHLPLSDTLNFETDQMRRAYDQFMDGEKRRIDTNAALERKVAELETANRVLQQRTRELVSLEDIGQALISQGSLAELASRVARRAVEVCKADRCVLYYLRSQDEADVLALSGWAATALGRRLNRAALAAMPWAEPAEMLDRPPGLDVPADSPAIRCGQAVPLLADGAPVGLMVIQSTRKSRFSPGEIALLRTLANQASVAMQRAGLVDDLRAKVAALEAAQADLRLKERLERDLELARQVQQSMLPRHFPDVPGLHFAARYAPARQVGGDFYDVIDLGDGRVALVIADVSDKGMPAALYMALARSLILAEARRDPTPRLVLRHVNQLLLELGQTDMFVTVFYGILDKAAGTLAYGRAGHDHPLLLRDGAIQALDGRGMALGLFEDGMFAAEERTLDVRPDDRLVLYTDGLTDVTNPDGEMLERPRLEAILLRHGDKLPEAMGRAVFADLAAFQRHAPPFDDMALLIVALS
jgi:serine phosphatase RsbU (regulator of sigma subunit)